MGAARVTTLLENGCWYSEWNEINSERTGFYILPFKDIIVNRGIILGNGNIPSYYRFQ